MGRADLKLAASLLAASRCMSSNGRETPLDHSIRFFQEFRPGEDGRSVRSSTPTSLPSSADQGQAIAMNDPPQDEPQGSRRGSGGSVRGRPAAAPPNQTGAAEGATDQQADLDGGPPPIIGVPIGLQGDQASVVSGPPLVGGGQRQPFQALHVNVGGANPYGRGASGGSPSSRAQSSAGYGFHAAPDPVPALRLATG